MVKVIGIGSGGGNAVNMLVEAGIDSALVELIAANTDDAHLRDSLAPIRIRMGARLTQGLGAKGMPDIGWKAAVESVNEISYAIADADLLFIAAGMGGGTGTGATLMVASIVKKMDIPLIGVVTMPFEFEGEQRTRIAEDAVNELRKYTDTLVIIQNQRLFEIADANTPLREVLIKGNEVLLQGVRNISGLISRLGDIALDRDSLHTMMSDIYRNTVYITVVQINNRK